MNVVLDVQYWSTSFDEPHEMTLVEGIPGFIDCGLHTSLPKATVRWDPVYLVSLDPISTYVTDDGRLFVVNPRITTSGTMYSCSFQNEVITTTRGTGFVRIIITGKYLCIT